MAGSGWKFWIDRGGTFTDLVAEAPNGQLHSMKLPSDAPHQYRDAAVECIRLTLEKFGNSNARIDEIRLGTTVATNALLERTGAATALVTNEGCADLLRIGNQQRSDIFALNIEQSEPLYQAVVEVAGRMDATGAELEALNLEQAREQFQHLRAGNIDSIAICLLHAWRSPIHEQKLATVARDAGFRHVSVSHQVSPLIKMVPRGVTTLIDAYLSPVLERYIEQFRDTLAQHDLTCSRLLLMQSGGGLVGPEFFTGKDALLSGPAGGVIGMATVAHQTNNAHLIGFDMGGTSTDVSLYAGEPEMTDQLTVAGMELKKPTLKIHTIASGGGSVLSFAQGRQQVGPQSAGAQPGPMAYGQGGPLTLTDANLLLGRLQPAFFPAVFGHDGKQSLNRPPVQHAFDQLAKQISNHVGKPRNAEEIATGFIEIAIDNMANAIRLVSTQRGLNPADFVLCCFGGAGGQHACQLAETLGISEVLLDPLAGVLSARGIGSAPLRRYRQASIDQPLNAQSLAALTQQETRLKDECLTELQPYLTLDTNAESQAWLALKQRGSDTLIEVRWEQQGFAAVLTEFTQLHRDRYGFLPADPQIEIASLRVELLAASNDGITTAASPDTTNPTPNSVSTVRVYANARWQSVMVHNQPRLKSGDTISGPALIIDDHSTLWLADGWTLSTYPTGQLRLQHRPGIAQPKAAETGTADPVRLEIFNNQLMHIATTMGSVLEQTAHSVNIKERLDFSCALFDANGNLLANAPHMPVHLGSMDDCIRSVIAEHGERMRSGDSFIANAPYKGGTHLPDVTVITPLFGHDQQLEFIVASRAHHADIGGMTPGSMPPHSQHISQEGVIFDNLKIVEDGELLETTIRAQLADNEWPARNPDQNIADLKAQLAANERGLKLLRELIIAQGRATVTQYCDYLLDNADTAVRQAISQLSDGHFNYPLDNGQQINVTIDIDRDKQAATIDFTGTSLSQGNNFNAPAAICQAAVMYVFRTLVNIDIPLNAGFRRALTIITPTDSLLNPSHPAAVVGGNVETSQCITDALFGALNVLAGSQGTMNNLSFGDAHLQYYETICGGTGAGEGFNGASAVQSHMTNSRMTDPEVLEVRFPVLVREFSVRKNSGGAGQYQGGDGVIRKLEFRQSVHAAILSNNRIVQPFGLNGGRPGQPGRNRIVRATGTIEEFDGIVATDVHAGDQLLIETPGGGGFGPPDTT